MPKLSAEKLPYRFKMATTREREKERAHVLNDAGGRSTTVPGSRGSIYAKMADTDDQI